MELIKNELNNRRGTKEGERKAVREWEKDGSSGKSYKWWLMNAICVCVNKFSRINQRPSLHIQIVIVYLVGNTVSIYSQRIFPINYFTVQHTNFHSAWKFEPQTLYIYQHKLNEKKEEDERPTSLAASSWSSINAIHAVRLNLSHDHSISILFIFVCILFFQFSLSLSSSRCGFACWSCMIPFFVWTGPRNTIQMRWTYTNNSPSEVRIQIEHYHNVHDSLIYMKIAFSLVSF